MAQTVAADDSVLIAKTGAGDPGALALLYRRHGAAVFGLALRVTGSREAAEEVTQDVFDRVWRAAASYRGERATVATWIMRIARNRAIDELRRSGRRSSMAIGEWEDGLAAGAGANPEEEVTLAADRRRVHEAVGRLPGAQRRALALAFFSGLSHAQIAEETGEPVGTIKTRIRLALRKLRDELGAEGAKQ